MKYQAKQKTRRSISYRTPNFFRRFLKFNRDDIIPAWPKPVKHQPTN